MNQNLMYFPCLAMLLLTFIVLLRMFVLRISAVKNKDIEIKYFKTYSAGNPPMLMVQADRHFSNLFEVPVLFYMVCVFSVITFHVDSKMLLAAWIYVFFRVIHAFSWIVLLYMGLNLGYKLLQAV